MNAMKQFHTKMVFVQLGGNSIPYNPGSAAGETHESIAMRVSNDVVLL